ncbi:MAG: zinc ABC transporter substrate-binding protein [Acidimicrobiia bacterium]|nr:zinc ABC transporter substrate-binding protein [Acidimicrobiia bacterium]
MRSRQVLPIAFLTLALVAGACSSGGSSSATADNGKLHVVAAENFWGSIAAQLGGDRATVKSIITNPDTDPHDYEATAADGRTVASAKYVIVNGIGYDPWASKLLAANPASARLQLNVGDAVGVKPGGNPHRWYSPPDVQKVIDQITADYKRLAPGDAAFFDRQRATFISTGLARYKGLVADIRTKYSGVPVGASESIFTPLADALGLKLITPESFLDAISEGGEPAAADKSAIENQIRNHQIKVYVFNRQNSTPDVQSQVALAKAQGIPVSSVTETLEPANASFQEWQADQLQSLESALAKATGK